MIPVAYAVALLAAVLAPASADEVPGESRTIEAAATGNAITFHASEDADRDVARRAASAAVYAEKRMAHIRCGSLDSMPRFTSCIDGIDSIPVVRTCADGTTALDPLFRREVDPATGMGLSPWEQVDNGGCPEDPDTTVVFTVEDFRRLPLTPSNPAVQPADGRNLVNVDLIAHTDPTPQTLTTEVLGTPVTVRATPSTYTWDFGDGTPPLTTTDPGRPWPHQSVTHPYTSAGTYTLTLTTTWSGEYQIAGTGPWLPIPGTATTTSPALTTTAEEATTHLVAEPTT